MSDDPGTILREIWNSGSPQIDAQQTQLIDPALITGIDAIINEPDGFLGFRYILPGQLLAKVSDPNRHTLALQKSSSLHGAFDARTFVKSYICTFDRENERVLGGSDDPLVGNIGRRPEMDDAWLAVGRRITQGGQRLVDILTYAQQHPEQAETLLKLTLEAIAKRLARTKIVYPRPNRISLSACESLTSGFLDERTGGRRLQALAAALFDTIGQHFSLFDAVEVGHVNKSDSARGDVADLNCRDTDGQTVLSVEVKDRQINTRVIEDTLRIARDRGVAEILFLIRGGVDPGEGAELAALQRRQFTSGHNVYHVEFESLLKPCLILFGEPGRLQFLKNIANRIDAIGELIDRQAWQHLLEAI